jgi:hypothetical protein
MDLDRLYMSFADFFDRIEGLRVKVASHPLFPNRKVAYGFACGLVTSAALKLGLDLNDPWVAYSVPVVSGYVVSWLVTDGAAFDHHSDEGTIEAEEKAVAKSE